MTNSASKEDNPISQTKPQGLRLFLFLDILLFVIAEAIAIMIVIKKHQLQLQSYFLPYIVIVWLPVPLLFGMRSIRKLKGKITNNNCNDSLMQSRTHIALTMTVSYFAILFCLLLALLGLHK